VDWDVDLVRGKGRQVGWEEMWSVSHMLARTRDDRQRTNSQSRKDNHSCKRYSAGDDDAVDAVDKKEEEIFRVRFSH